MVRFYSFLWMSSIPLYMYHSILSAHLLIETWVASTSWLLIWSIVSLLDFKAWDTVWFLECALWIILPFAMKMAYVCREALSAWSHLVEFGDSNSVFYFTSILSFSVQNGSFCWSKFLKSFVSLSRISLRAIPLEKPHTHRFF